jgi:CHAT domain-containing protein
VRDFEARLRLEEPVFSSGVFAPVLGLDQTQREVLGPEDLLLSFHVREKAAYAWAVTRTEARIYRLPPPSSWRGQIRRFLQALDSPAERNAAGSRLYGALLGGLDPALLAKHHWIIAADGDLVSLPFCALPAPGEAAKRYLVEQRSFSYAPSVSILHSLNQRGIEPYQYEFLGLADPVVNRADPRWDGRPPSLELPEGLPRLISSEPEIRAAARLFPPGRSTLLTGFDVSEARLRRSAEQSHRYWHLSSHVVVDAERPNHSFVALSIPRQGPRMEKLTPLDIAWLPVRAEMVVLNGCDSGTGKTLPGEGVMGLARAFLAAGARSVVATRWKIPDEGGALTQRLYAHLQQNGGARVDRAGALRQAQLEMIRAGDWRSSPRYWAAYFLVGASSEPRQ